MTPKKDTADEGERPTVLVVEDDADLRHAITTYLQTHRNLTVLPASDGEEARQWAERGDLRIDVAVVDIVLPDAFGSQVALDQAFLHPGIRTIYMSGHVLGDTVLAATMKDRAATVFLQKPFDLSDLGDAIERVLNQG